MIAIALVTLPMHDFTQKILHLYYRRCLRKAFFHNGVDISGAAIAANPYCPNLLLGASVHDFRQPAETANAALFSFGTFFLGSSRTGYCHTPANSRLARLIT